ncbi:hypothetical protein [Aeromicrobium wangtongii]|uniref:hypothetical protein n=1 Tax=Aeromicrobium wangtongii TaxID=2969247 RepID=UPI002017EA2B|nr:hypothetical protein [Aeromicrobium wangtongii]MCL3817661.1 hypothetical protein [Aeromicrobium wangtongii]
MTPSVMLSSCAKAATAAESKFRIDAPVESRRGRIIALDSAAAEVARSVAEHEWVSARFFACEVVSPGIEGGEVLLRHLDGTPAVLADELDGTHVVVMIATEDSGSDSAYAVGRACWERSIMTAGVVVGGDRDADLAVAALRPHARVLLPTADESDVVDLLTALRV